MATAITAARAGEIKLQYGEPQIFGLKFLTAKAFDGTHGPRGMFTATDERKLWLDAEDASDVERELRALGVRAGDPIRVTKIRMPRGGGHAIRVERVEPLDEPAWVRDAGTAPASREEALLEASVALARTRGAQAFHARPAEASADRIPLSATAEAPARTASHQLMSAYLAAIDAVTEAQTYADRKGLKVTFTSEDVRATALSAFIQAEKAAMGARF